MWNLRRHKKPSRAVLTDIICCTAKNHHTARLDFQQIEHFMIFMLCPVTISGSFVSKYLRSSFVVDSGFLKVQAQHKLFAFSTFSEWTYFSHTAPFAKLNSMQRHETIANLTFFFKRCWTSCLILFCLPIAFSYAVELSVNIHVLGIFRTLGTTYFRYRSAIGFSSNSQDADLRCGVNFFRRKAESSVTDLCTLHFGICKMVSDCKNQFITIRAFFYTSLSIYQRRFFKDEAEDDRAFSCFILVGASMHREPDVGEKITCHRK